MKYLDQSAFPRVLAFDAESNDLHGPIFAIGGVLLSPSGETEEEFFARAPMEGIPVPFVDRHVLPALAGTRLTHADRRSMRDAFWAWLRAAMECRDDLLIVADCRWPVEIATLHREGLTYDTLLVPHGAAALLSACIGDDPEARAFQGPYPLHEVASFLYAAGYDPMGSYAEALLPSSLPRPHHPVWDALVSAHCARMALHTLRETASVARAARA